MVLTCIAAVSSRGQRQLDHHPVAADELPRGPSAPSPTAQAVLGATRVFISRHQHVTGRQTQVAGGAGGGWRSERALESSGGEF